VGELGIIVEDAEEVGAFTKEDEFEEENNSCAEVELVADFWVEI